MTKITVPSKTDIIEYPDAKQGGGIGAGADAVDTPDLEADAGKFRSLLSREPKPEDQTSSDHLLPNHDKNPEKKTDPDARCPKDDLKQPAGNQHKIYEKTGRPASEGDAMLRNLGASGQNDRPRPFPKMEPSSRGQVQSAPPKSQLSPQYETTPAMTDHLQSETREKAGSVSGQKPEAGISAADDFQADAHPETPYRKAGRGAPPPVRSSDNQWQDSRFSQKQKPKSQAASAQNGPVSKLNGPLRSETGKPAENKLPPADRDKPDPAPVDASSSDRNRPMQPDSARPPYISGDMLLQSMQNRPIPETPLQGKEQASQTASISEAVRDIADRILVSDTASAGKQEVRIMLKNDMLPGTEIRISKTGDGITVDFVTTAADSFQLLSNHKQNLTDHLNERLGNAAKVNIRFEESRQGQNDGRSRQQRNLYDEMQD